jgi:hypothetical protein
LRVETPESQKEKKKTTVDLKGDVSTDRRYLEERDPEGRKEMRKIQTVD